MFKPGEKVRVGNSDNTVTVVKTVKCDCPDNEGEWYLVTVIEPNGLTYTIHSFNVFKA